MINWISSWAQQIIVAVIIVTIIEMIIPKGNNSKYIKTMLGIYIMFTILSPFIELFTKQNISFANYDYDSFYVNTEEYKTLESKITNTENKNIEDTYILKLKQDIEEKLNKKGYIVSSIKLDIDLKNENEYGKIKSIALSISKDNLNNEQEKEVQSSEINIEKIQIGSSSKINNTNKKQEISQTEIDELNKRITTFSTQIVDMNDPKLLPIKQSSNVVTSLFPGETAFSVLFMTMGNQDIQNYAMTCKNTDLFVTLEEKLYNDYPKYKNYDTFFQVNTRRIKRFKTIEENHINSGKPIILNTK